VACQASAWRAGLLAIAVLLTHCAAPATAPDPPSKTAAVPTVRIYLLRRGWHTDVVLPVAGLPPPLAAITADFPGARYLIFGFGDRHYVLATHKDMGELLLAPVPGAGLVLVSALNQAPEQQFGSEKVAPLDLEPAQVDGVASFIWQSLQHPAGGSPRPYLAGHYAGNLYYAATESYSGLFTCNTWTARALKAGGVRVNSFGVLFAGQVWSQVAPAANSGDQPTVK
jgi:uncharacterized protein (TIGR02117 family)